MPCKKLIPSIYLKDGKAYADAEQHVIIGDGDALEAAVRYSENGADEILVWDLSYDDASHEYAIGILRKITKSIDTPIIAGGNVNRVEDVKKYLYAGARAAVLDDRRESNMLMMKEVTDRFGKNKIGVALHHFEKDVLNLITDNELSFILAPFESDIFYILDKFDGIPAIIGCNDISHDTFEASIETLTDILSRDRIYGATGAVISGISYDFMKAKHELKQAGIETNTFESAIPFSEFKLNSEGLIPVIVQDYKTDEVLMLAYMNEESYNLTVRTGRMTYYSRSREELWTKGETSGHFQYVRSIEIDCDNDTLLAKVKQIGAACHTGNKSCFYRNLISTEYAETNPLKIFNQVMAIIEDRKLHPKEGSYTNYLFDKGIDKILKKCGEEATEIVIAAKNPDPEEIKYEISDFLYHVMVLMALKDVTWDDIVKELANR
jgi:phosphoribosyl-ATP pyrophosphohydrolase/phosphoribosyl-AMP cyclohydrolase